MADKKTEDGGVAQVQKAQDEVNKNGFRGMGSDPTPNENYSVAGVTKGAPTPETDEKAAEKARQALAG